MREDEALNQAELGLDELDDVAGGAGREGFVEVDGQVIEALPNAMFRVQLNDGRTITCNLAGKLRMNYIRVLPGDSVTVEMSLGDPSRGRIIWRTK